MLIPYHSETISNRARVIRTSTQRCFHKFRIEFLLPGCPENVNGTPFNCKNIQRRTTTILRIIRSLFLWRRRSRRRSRSIAQFYPIRKLTQKLKTPRRKPKERMVTHLLGRRTRPSIPVDHRQNQIARIGTHKLQIFLVGTILHYIRLALVPLSERMRSRKDGAVEYTPERKNVDGATGAGDVHHSGTLHGRRLQQFGGRRLVSIHCGG
mmetsp:Transcript_15136/g.27483  ORF Transcript_15136/g.27483 Transcript_15136/m.27483 type:complete len:209 (+) Transcript_15136:1112-1738(+)